MKIYTLLFFCFIFIFSQFSFTQCKPRVIAKNCKPNMGEFLYDDFVMNELVFDDRSKKIEIEFTAFAGEKYKLVFCTSGFNDSLKLNIFNKSNKVKSRKKVYDNQNGLDNLFWSFSPPNPGTYYIEYDIPVAINPTKKNTGCIVMLIGYEE